MEQLLTAYIECALWSTTDESTPQGGEPLDTNYGPTDLTPETLERMRADCEAFLNANTGDIGTAYTRTGHDFWLTRNRHGAGFWDGDWPEDVGERLTRAAHAFGECELYVGDDAKVYAF